MTIAAHEVLLEWAVDALAWMAPPPVYVGGATVPIHLDAVHAKWARHTEDVDCMVDVVSPMALAELETGLRQHGLRHDADSGVICRWLTQQDLKIDVMPTNGSWYGHTNTWLSTAVEHTFEHTLPSGRAIRVVQPEWLFAAKLEAYQDRGAADPYASKDLEDLVLLALGCPQLVSRVAMAPARLGHWVAQECAKIDRGYVAAQTPRTFKSNDAMTVFKVLILNERASERGVLLTPAGADACPETEGS